MKLGIDIGSISLTTALLDENNNSLRIITSGTREIPFLYCLKK
ncbi:MAG: hypothetical protein AB1630_12395 [bacterium]